MANFIDTVKAIITRLIFSAHGLVAIYRCAKVNKFANPYEYTRGLPYENNNEVRTLKTVFNFL